MNWSNVLIFKEGRKQIVSFKHMKYSYNHLYLDYFREINIEILYFKSIFVQFAFSLLVQDEKVLFTTKLRVNRRMGNSSFTCKDNFSYLKQYFSYKY